MTMTLIRKTKMEDEDILAVRRLALSLKPRFEAGDVDYDDMWDWVCVLADYVIESTMDFADQDELPDEDDL